MKAAYERVSDVVRGSLRYIVHHSGYHQAHNQRLERVWRH